MELTKKDERHIQEQAMKIAWRAEVEASEYAHLYKLRYLEVLKDKLDYRIRSEQGIYDAQLKIGTNE